VGLERGPLSVASTTEELLGRESSYSGLESKNTSDHLASSIHKKLALTSLTNVGRSFGIVQATELFKSIHVCINGLSGYNFNTFC
jgi:hypothetical protein